MYKIVHALISHSHSIVIGRYYRICRFSFFITMFLRRISYYNIEYNSFSGRNTAKTLRMAFSSNHPSIQLPNPSAAAAKTICAAATPISICGKCFRLIQPPKPAEILALSSTITICTGACLVKWLDVQYSIRCRICYTIFQLRIIDYDKMPRLRITG